MPSTAADRPALRRRRSAPGHGTRPRPFDDRDRQGGRGGCALARGRDDATGGGPRPRPGRDAARPPGRPAARPRGPGPGCGVDRPSHPSYPTCRVLTIARPRRGPPPRTGRTAPAGTGFRPDVGMPAHGGRPPDASAVPSARQRLAPSQPCGRSRAVRPPSRPEHRGCLRALEGRLTGENPGQAPFRRRLEETRLLRRVRQQQVVVAQPTAASAESGVGARAGLGRERAARKAPDG